MDELASASWLIFAIYVLVLLVFFIAFALIIRRATTDSYKTKSPLFRNLLSVIIFYLLSSTYFFIKFGSYIGQIFAFKFLPILSLIILLSLELLQLTKDVIRRTKGLR